MLTLGGTIVWIGPDSTALYAILAIFEDPDVLSRSTVPLAALSDTVLRWDFAGDRPCSAYCYVELAPSAVQQSVSTGRKRGSVQCITTLDWMMHMTSVVLG